MTDEANDKIVIALVGNLGDPNQGDPQVSIHTSVDRDSPDLDKFLDRVHAAFVRQKAAAEIVRVEKHIRMCEKQIATAHANDSDREERYLTDVGRLRDNIQRMQDKVPGILKADEEDWNSKERAGPYKQSARTERTLTLLKNDASNLTTDIANLGLERDAAIKSHNQVISSWAGDIAEAKAEIERLKALVG